MSLEGDEQKWWEKTNLVKGRNVESDHGSGQDCKVRMRQIYDVKYRINESVSNANFLKVGLSR